MLAVPAARVQALQAMLAAVREPMARADPCLAPPVRAAPRPAGQAEVQKAGREGLVPEATASLVQLLATATPTVPPWASSVLRLLRRPYLGRLVQRQCVLYEFGFGAREDGPESARENGRTPAGMRFVAGPRHTREPKGFLSGDPYLYLSLSREFPPSTELWA